MQAISHFVSQPLKGTLTVPGDKSCSHRAIIFASLATGETIIHGLLEGEDVMHTAQVMRDMGADIQRHDNAWQVTGVGDAGLETPSGSLDFGNSGTSARLLCGVLSGYAVQATFVGDASLSSRPFGRVTRPLSQMGAVFDGETLPLSVTGQSTLMPMHHHSKIASAQVKSAILLAGLQAKGTTQVTEPVISRDHTERLLPAFGVPVSGTTDTDGRYTASLEGPAALHAPDAPLYIPADPSSAAFPTVAALMIKGSAIILPGVGLNPTRIGLFDSLRDMGADLQYHNQRIVGAEPVADIHVAGTGALNGITIPASRIPSMIDEVPILAMVAALANGTTHIPNLAELRVKESDRLAIVASGLQACGVAIEEGPDSLTIHGLNGQQPQGGAIIAAHLDHRIAMSFLILGAACADPVTIDDTTPIDTSFPDFVRLMNGLGLQIDNNNCHNSIF